MNLFRTNTIIFLITLLICAGLTEMGSYYYLHFSTAGWDAREEPTAKSVFAGKEVSGMTNSHGIRDREYPENHDTYRILALGDSFTYGVGLKNESRWPKQTEKLLHEDGLKSIEILNGGRPGTNTAWQYDFFSKYGYLYQPNLLIVGFIVNDCTTLCSNCGAVNTLHSMQALATKRNHLSWSYSLFNLRRLGQRLTQQTLAEYLNSYRGNHNSFTECREAFIKLRERALLSGFELVVVIYPMLIQLGPNYPLQEIHDKMLSFFKDNQIEAFDLTPSFYGRPERELWLTSSDSHPNKTANTIAATRIAEIIRDHFDRQSVLHMSKTTSKSH